MIKKSLIICLCLLFILAVKASEPKKHPKNLIVYESDKFSYDKLQPDANADVQVAPRTFLFGSIPRKQFNAFWGVSLPITAIGLYWDCDSDWVQVLKAIAVYTMIFNVPRFFGYFISFSASEDDPAEVLFHLQKLNFIPGKGVVSFERWVMAIVFCYCQILFLLPKETYAMLVEEYGFSSYDDLSTLLFISMLFTLGIFEAVTLFFFEYFLNLFSKQ